MKIGTMISSATSASFDMIENETLTTRSLQNLQSDGERKVLDIVDKLRRQGLNGILELPQLVVCGDQSSGKSSVLEAITEIPFPRKENLCTRFATEIVLRRQPTDAVSITISPSKLRNDEEQTKLKGFNKTIANLDELPEIIEEATLAMDLGRVGEVNSRAFSRDVLCVEICGPNRPQLTLVDLPGLIHATNKAQNESDKELILDLVQGYMKSPRTIILAVVSAKNDFANQVILDHCQKIDKNGRRTLGIITKPDYLRPGSENEKSWIDLASNKDIYLERGWHMLKNRADDEMDFSFEQRNQAEEAFFSTGRYVDLPRKDVGVDSLRKRLSDLLLSHLIQELPQLKKEMNAKLQDTLKSLESLGEKRETIAEQRVLLMKISTEINSIFTAAVNGHYKHNFFDTMDMDEEIDSDVNIRRLRAVIQHHNSRFSENVLKKGYRYAIRMAGEPNQEWLSEETDTTGNDSDQDHPALPLPENMSREDAISWVRNVMARSRGHELPGTFNPEVISHLFWEQSKPWADIANIHINEIARVCQNFVNQVLQHAVPAEFHARLSAVAIEDKLTKASMEARAELQRLLDDKARHPMTYNHYFTSTVQKNRHDKYKNLVSQAQSSSSKNYVSDKTKPLLYVEEFQKHMETAIEQDIDKYTAEEALNNLRAYYKDEMKYFVHAVTKQVIERHLVDPLPKTILSPLVVVSMTDKEVSFIAAEPGETVSKRAHFEEKKKMLENGLQYFNEAMGGLRR